MARRAPPPPDDDMLSLFGRRRPHPNDVLLDRLHREIVAALRRPALYLAYGVPDTFEGRFELLCLHAGLVLRRLDAAEAPGPAVAQDLVDTIFAHLDADLREAGVGDITVPKRMKRLAEAFLGRSAAYDAALGSGRDALSKALARNVYAGKGDADRLSRYVERAAADLAATPLAALLSEPLHFPDPSSISELSLP